MKLGFQENEKYIKKIASKMNDPCQALGYAITKIKNMTGLTAKNADDYTKYLKAEKKVKSCS